MPKVREDLGYPPLVTPTSQIVGTQAVLNVVMGERYKMVPKETKGLVKASTERHLHQLRKKWSRRLSVMTSVLHADLLI